MSEQRAMSTASQIARARGAAGQGAGVGADDRATCLDAKTTRQAAAAAQAAVAAAAALPAEMEWEEPELAGGRSRSPIERCRQLSSPERRRGRRGRSSVLQTVYRDTGAGTPWPMLTKGNYHEFMLGSMLGGCILIADCIH